MTTFRSSDKLGTTNVAGDDKSMAEVSVYVHEDNRTVETAVETPKTTESEMTPTSKVEFVEPGEPAPKPVPSLQLVLLLMDPTSRRFELLQLEFDSDKAKVSDIISQIPVSVTEDAIRKQKYVSVVDCHQNEMGGRAVLAEFCKEKEVLVALPQDISVKDCVRLARPILKDEKVVTMVGVLRSLFQSPSGPKMLNILFSLLLLIS